MSDNSDNVSMTVADSVLPGSHFALPHWYAKSADILIFKEIKYHRSVNLVDISAHNIFKEKARETSNKADVLFVTKNLNLIFID